MREILQDVHYGLRNLSNDTMARKYFPNEEPVGKRILIQEIVPGKTALGPEIAWEVAGVVKDEKVANLGSTTGAGLVPGFLGVLALTRLPTSLLFGAGARDLITIVGAGGILAAVAFFASYGPARRTAKVDPMICLPYE